MITFDREKPKVHEKYDVTKMTAKFDALFFEESNKVSAIENMSCTNRIAPVILTQKLEVKSMKFKSRQRNLTDNTGFS